MCIGKTFNKLFHFFCSQCIFQWFQPSSIGAIFFLFCFADQTKWWYWCSLFLSSYVISEIQYRMMLSEFGKAMRRVYGGIFSYETFWVDVFFPYLSHRKLQLKCNFSVEMKTLWSFVVTILMSFNVVCSIMTLCFESTYISLSLFAYT